MKMLSKGKKTKKAIKMAAEITARYSDAENGEVEVSYGEKSIIVEKPLSYDEKDFRI